MTAGSDEPTGGDGSLAGVHVALGVTGSIAAVKTVELAHELRRRGAEVRAVMTESAQGILHPWAVEFATEHDVVTEITGGVEHVALCGRDEWADVLVVAPATANTVGKMASAVDDSPVTTTATTALGTGLPVVVAPAMHEPMYDHPGVLDAIETLESWGVDFVDPRIEEGKAKVASMDAIALATAAEMTDAVLDVAGEADALVSVAAISDYTVAASDEKIRSAQEGLTLELEPTRKLVDTVRDAHPELPVVGFKAETSGDDAAMVERARATADRVGMAFVVANDASVMGREGTRALLVHDEGYAEFAGSKAALGREVVAALAEVLG